MKNIPRQFIDWQKTGRNLEFLRDNNMNLRRTVCQAHNHEHAECSGDCVNCMFEVDNHISRRELAEVFGVSETVIVNWESGKTRVQYEDLLFYAQLAQCDVKDIVVFSK